MTNFNFSWKRQVWDSKKACWIVTFLIWPVVVTVTDWVADIFRDQLGPENSGFQMVDNMFLPAFILSLLFSVRATWLRRNCWLEVIILNICIPFFLSIWFLVVIVAKFGMIYLNPDF